ncbi:P-loop containing nucleoside triphosphate hydrolase protein [Penicillium maclennaniae]|uniref:P-loop containing nucleoside triphosphate hydrolase protein n=1 Tax=Penicillium maclennaniae TaxID=1343394 RepID=UPI002540CE3A|nr:P-loop containing nucleoside triphosphate hydrolase protein [Penicillium maclennaniae]KAJ5678494.1 P-loop containing nucleoside triphosphate hydrolase protein [Penicillium maclennaniae]
MAANGGAQDEAVIPPDETFFRNGVEPRTNDVFIAVMGVTGSGKSSFISLLAEPGTNVSIGHGTQGVNSYLYKHDDDINVYLIDTPGFDDTNRDDSDVLREIALWLSESIKSSVKLSGMFYLHRIADPRMQGTAKKNLLMFKRLCGENALKNVILVTTMWDKVKDSEGDARERELKETEDFWGYMVRNGSRVERHFNNQESAKQLVSKLLKEKRIELTIQDEMVREKRDLNQTNAGRTLDNELASEREKWQKLAVQQKADMDEAMRLRDKQLATVLSEERLKSEAKAKKLNEEREKLRVNLADLRRENQRRMQRMLEAQQAQLREENEYIAQKTLEDQQVQLQRQSDQIKMLQRDHSRQTRTRSHPGSNCIQECRSISLVGDWFYFCGPKTNDR